MNYDYYASLAEQESCPKKINEGSLASGFVDGCLVWSCCGNKAKNDARRCYMKRASDLKDLKLPSNLNLEPNFSQLPDPAWIGIEVEFKLLTPWYSKDDRPFHVLDNPVRKDRVFGVPLMSAASWKGLLRWACRMQEELFEHLKTHDMKLDGWKDPAWIVHLFGNERDEVEKFSRGALAFYPTWFDKVGFEVINPHNRKTRAGIQPIYYEVVKAETEGVLRLLYAPLPGQIEKDKINPVEVTAKLIDSITALLETYGISANRTSGWGAVEVKSGIMYLIEGNWLKHIDGSDENKQYVSPSENFMELMENNGIPIRVLLNKDNTFLSKTGWRKLGDKKLCNKKVFEEFKEWYESHGREYRRRMKGDEERGLSPKVREFPFESLSELKENVKKLEIARKGGD